MNKLTIVGAALTAALTFSTEARAAVKVITSTQDLASIVSEIGGDKVTVEALARGYQDPHQVEAKPSFVIKLHGADLRSDVAGRKCPASPRRSRGAGRTRERPRCQTRRSSNR